MLEADIKKLKTEKRRLQRLNRVIQKNSLVKLKMTYDRLNEDYQKKLDTLLALQHTFFLPKRPEEADILLEIYQHSLNEIHPKKPSDETK